VTGSKDAKLTNMIVNLSMYISSVDLHAYPCFGSVKGWPGNFTNQT